VELARDALDAITVPVPRPAPTPAPEPVPEPVPAPTVRHDEPTRPVRDEFASAPTRLAADATRQAEPPTVPEDRSPTKRSRTSAHWWRRKAVLIPAAAVVLTVITVAVVGVMSGNPSTPSTSPSKPSASRQSTLPFTGLNYPSGVAVDGNGTVYVTDYGNNRVVTLAKE
jgi:serine/threonine protein kinase, bacterial